MNSLSIHATHLIGLKARDYRTPTGQNSGLLLLFLVIQESTLQTKSTTNSLWGKLTAGLPGIMHANANNIMTFNTEVREIQQRLRSQGQDPSSIIPQLFAVYQGCEGEETAFFRFVEYLENDYNNGAVLTSVDLMYKAEEKYKEIKERQRYTTGKDKPSDLVALQTKVEALTQRLKDKKTPGGSDKKKERERPPRDNQEQWMFKKPSGGEPSTKTVNEKEFHWCDGNGAHKAKWVRHLPSECRGKDRSEGEPNEEEAGSPAGAGGWSAAMQAIISDVDDE
jgi:hypothetical protein